MSGLLHLLAALPRQAAALPAELALAAETLATLDDGEFNTALAVARQSWAAAALATPTPQRRCRALAAAAEAAWRGLGQRPSTPQLRAAWALSEGLVVELGAGQGKTLALALAAVLAAWQGRRCLVVVAHELGAEAQARAMAPLLQRCGLRVAVLPATAAAKGLPEADVTYTTARPLFAATQASLGSPRNTAVLFDDLDRVLADETAAPFVAAEPGHNPLLLAGVAAAAALHSRFEAERDYRHLPGPRFEYSAAGQALLEDITPELPPLWRAPQRRDELLMQALVVRDRLQAGRHYTLEGSPEGGGRVQLEQAALHTVLPGRGLQTGLVQAIEAQNGWPLSHPVRVTTRCTFQDFFAGHAQRAGIARSLRGQRTELLRQLGLRAVQVPAPAVAAPPTRLQTLASTTARHAAAAQAASAWATRQWAVVLSVRRAEEMAPLTAALQALGLTPLPWPELRQAGAPWRLAAGDVLLAPETWLADADIAAAFAPSSANTAGLALLMAEPPDSRRTQQALAQRGASQPWPRAALVLASLDDPRLPAGLPRLPGALRLAPAFLRLQRWLAARQARAARGQTLQRERQIQQQFAFAGQRHGARVALKSRPVTADM